MTSNHLLNEFHNLSLFFARPPFSRKSSRIYDYYLKERLYWHFFDCIFWVHTAAWILVTVKTIYCFLCLRIFNSTTLMFKAREISLVVDIAQIQFDTKRNTSIKKNTLFYSYLPNQRKISYWSLDDQSWSKGVNLWEITALQY